MVGFREFPSLQWGFSFTPQYGLRLPLSFFGTCNRALHRQCCWLMCKCRQRGETRISVFYFARCRPLLISGPHLTGSVIFFSCRKLLSSFSSALKNRLGSSQSFCDRSQNPAILVILCLGRKPSIAQSIFLQELDVCSPLFISPPSSPLCDLV